MFKCIATILIIILLIPSPAVFCADNDSTGFGFGQQPVLIDSNIRQEILAKRVLSATKYKLTPGDTYELVIRIETTERVPLILLNSYKLEIPYLGTINVKGMYFSELRDMVIKSIKSRFPVDFVDLVLSSPAIFDVFIYGGVENPGIASVTPINRITEAISLAKGLKKGASYRHIDLIRDGQTISCDLSRFVRDADYSQNPLLEPGDKIYIPHADVLAQISGRVKYPDTYELLPGETLNDLLKVAGGILPGASTNKIEVARIADKDMPSVMQVNLEEAATFQLKHGDRVQIRGAFENQEMVLLEAALFGKPSTGEEAQIIPTQPIVANIPYTPSLTLLQLLEKFGGPTPIADGRSSFIERTEGIDKEKIFVDVTELWKKRELSHDITLRPGDHVVIPLKKMRIMVSGAVSTPGSYNFFTGGKVADYIGMAGGLDMEKASFRGIYFVNMEYKRKRVDLTTEVSEPGTVIFVDKNAYEHANNTMAKTLIFISFAAAAISLTTSIVDLIKDIRR
jgi:protein involved in polysaccharide export with SLBB domain